MKKNFKKSLSVLLAVLTLVSVMSVSASAAVYNVIFTPDENCSPEDTAKAYVTDENGVLLIPKEPLFSREGHRLIGWSNSPGGAAAFMPDTEVTFLDNSVIYPVWKANKYTYKFILGAGATASGSKTGEKNYGTLITPPTKPKKNGYVFIGWTQDENGTVPELLPGEKFVLKYDVVYYAIWELPQHEISTKEEVSFKDSCIKKDAEPLVFEIVNSGNQTETINTISSENYNFSYSPTNRKLDMNEKLTVTVTPKEYREIGSYAETLEITGTNGVSTSIIVNQKIVDHVYSSYVSDGDATYESDGHKTAVCLNGCGEFDNILDIGSMKKYGAEYNNAQGLLKVYEYHKTIRFTAYGTGCDDYEYIKMKRYVPVSWYVNEKYNGEIEAGANGSLENGDFDVIYVHDTFGTYQLKLKFVEMEMVFDEDGNPMLDENDMPIWTECKDAEGNTVTDEKVFTYRVGPSEKEQQEVVMPNMIVNIIFGLFGYLFDVIKTIFG